MSWCWQQAPELRPTASRVVEVVKAKEFSSLLAGVCISDYGKVLCASYCIVHTASCQEQKETLASSNDSNSFCTSHNENLYYTSKNTINYEIWISNSNNIQSSTVTILKYCGKFTAIEVCYKLL